MILERKNVKIDCPMFFDTGSWKTYLRRDTLIALGIKGDLLPLGAQVAINGVNTLVFESTAHFENVDLLNYKLKSLRIFLQLLSLT